MKTQPSGRKHPPALLILLCCCCSATILAACGNQKTVSFAGETMGTVYRITARVNQFTDTAALQKAVTARLKEINASMSTYRETSEISRFNDLREAGATLAVSEDLAKVVRLGRHLHTLTRGAWDGTVWPLVKVWGFHHADRPPTVPPPKTITAALECVDFSKITITTDNRLSKARADMYLDLASIAKGYGVDQLAELLRQKAVKNFIVEIGGEVFAAGVKKRGRPWTVGINDPRPGAAFHAVRRAIIVLNQAVATSGDYRNYFEVHGRLYSHILDPQTGYPARTGVVSASVVADTCAIADGLATALMVMGAEKGLALINRLADTECLLTVKAEDGTLTDHMSRNFQELVCETGEKND